MINKKDFKIIKLILLTLFTVLVLSCEKSPQFIKESWIKKTVSEWPNFALTNEISLEDSTYVDIANSFIVDTGYDTIAVSCKHLFMLFENKHSYNNIALENKINYWKMYPKNNRKEEVLVKRLINENSSEPIGPYNKLKARDWIIFELEEKNLQLYPLKIRYTPIKKDEIIYAVGWKWKQNSNKPFLKKIKCYRDFGNYYYIYPSENQPHGMSGSPVIDKNGFLVGIVSGQEGRLGIIGSVKYLTKIFNDYQIKYKRDMGIVKK